MTKIFIEYCIQEANRESYWNYMTEKCKQTPEIEWLESIEKKNVFLEMWTLQDPLDVPVQECLDQNLMIWIEGGLAKVRKWQFKTCNH